MNIIFTLRNASNFEKSNGHFLKVVQLFSMLNSNMKPFVGWMVSAVLNSFVERINHSNSLWFREISSFFFESLEIQFVFAVISANL